MEVFTEIHSFRTFLETRRVGKDRIGLVPTMGALHMGHISLLESCKALNDVTVCSIFVNPAQFNNRSDLDKYPRNLDKDLKLLQANGCDVVFAPTVGEIYPEPSVVSFDFGPLAERLEGKYRPGHFNGVGLIVSKLLNIIQPDNAFFGQKDLQQYVIISQLVNDLSFPVSLHCEPIVRETGGLALSSRNERLNAEQKQRAACLYASLMQGREAVRGGKKPADEIAKAMFTWLEEQGVEPEYYEIVNAVDLSQIHSAEFPDKTAICVAAYVGDVRLIDNLITEKESRA